MDKTTVPIVGKSREVGRPEGSREEGSTGIFLGSEIMPAVTVRIPMPQGAAAPAQAAPQPAPTQTALQATPQAAQAHAE